MNYGTSFLHYYEELTSNRNFSGVLLASHSLYSYYQNFNRQLLFLSIVRNPIETGISWFCFFSQYIKWCKLKGVPADCCYYNSKSMRISLLNGTLADATLNNPQCRYLGGNTFEEVLEVWSKENFLVGCFDFQQEFVGVCADLLCWSHRTFPHENANFEENYQQRYLEEPGLVDLLLERNQEDSRLYNYLKQNIVVNTIKPEFDLAPLHPVQDEESIGV